MTIGNQGSITATQSSGLISVTTTRRSGKMKRIIERVIKEFNNYFFSKTNCSSSKLDASTWDGSGTRKKTGNGKIKRTRFSN